MVPGMNATGLDKSDPLTKQGDGWGFAATDAPVQSVADDAVADESNVSQVDEQRLIRLQQQAVQQSTTYLSSVKTSWDRSYRAYRNEHFNGSKYTSEAYKGRSKTF